MYAKLYFSQQYCADVGAVLLAWWGQGYAYSGGGVRELSRDLSSKAQALGDFLLAWRVMGTSQCELLYFTSLTKSI